MSMLQTKRVILACSVEANKDGQVLNKKGKSLGLLYSHSYIINDVFEIPDYKDDKVKHRLLRIKNPWGDIEWNGQWSDNSQEFLNHGKM